jgi:hypothetical protein
VYTVGCVEFSKKVCDELALQLRNKMSIFGSGSGLEKTLSLEKLKILEEDHCSKLCSISPS